MATNKNALIRYKILDTCFRNPGRNYTIKDLIEECNKLLTEINPESAGISRRQVYDDIAFMESNEGWGIELNRQRNGRNVIYRYTDMAFSINNMPLNELEIDQIRSAMDILAQFEGMPQFEWLHEILPKLKQGINNNEKPQEIISFDNNQYLKGIEFLGRLYNAIHYKQILSISYQPFTSTSPYDLIIHPYYLKQYNNRWFLFGYNPENGKHDWNLALDRMLKIQDVGDVYNINTTIDWTEYFEDIIGVTKHENNDVDNIKLHFYGITGKYIESKPIHGSQRSRWINDEVLEVDLQLIINFELEKFILSNGNSVKVIFPENLVNKIKERVKNL